MLDGPSWRVRESSQLTIASRIGEAQPGLGFAREKKPRRASIPDESVLDKVCRSLEAAGLSVVVVVTLGATPTPTMIPSGHILRRVRRSLETTGLSVMADVASDETQPARHSSGKANLALIRGDAEDGRVVDRRASRVAEHTGPVIVLTTAPDEAAARAAFVAGGLGYLVKAGAVVPPATSSTFVERSAERRQVVGTAVSTSGPVAPPVAPHGLTSREVEVMRALATGASTVEVARELYVSPKTAKNHIAHIYAKLGVSSRTQAVAKALRQGIVKID